MKTHPQFEEIAMSYWTQNEPFTEYSVLFYQQDEHNDTSYGVEIWFYNPPHITSGEEILYESPNTLTFKEGLDLYSQFNRMYREFCIFYNEHCYPQYEKYMEEKRQQWRKLVHSQKDIEYIKAKMEELDKLFKSL